MEIRHLAFTSDWDAARIAGSYCISTRGASLDHVGFIHCSFEEQLPRVAAFVYADVADPLTVLVIDGDEVEAGGAAIIVEDGGDGEEFPHIYGALDPACVVRALPARMVGGELVVDGE